MTIAQNAGQKAPSLLTRTTFETSRLLEFFTDRELSMQIGASRSTWPLALVKELLDNALDACAGHVREPPRVCA
jgi:hypothetical protein